MSTPRARTIAPDWISKTLAGALLGFTLAIGCAGVFSWLAQDMPMTERGQLAMWMTAPIWLGVLSTVYFFRSGTRAWAWLALANVLVFAPLAVSRLL